MDLFYQSSSNSQAVRVPKLRFPEFEGEYRTATLREIANKVIRIDPNSDAPVMMISAASGFINQSEKYSRENAGQSLKKYTLLKKGELAYNHGASKLRQFGCCFELKEKAARIPYVYHTFSIDEKEYAPYIALLLNNPIMDRQLKRLVSSSVRMDGLLNISYEEYMSIRLSIPMLKTEQEKLHSFIEKLDQRIQKQRQLVELLKSYKRGVLSKLFPQKGETTPRYRFAGFTEPWEQRKLIDEVSSVDTGKSKFIPRESGDYEILGSTSVIGYDDSYDYEGDFLLTARVGANAGELYRHSGKVKISDNTVFIQGKPLDFIYYTLLNFDIKKLSFGTGQPLVKASELKEQKISMPISNRERKQIGKYFRHLDHLITLYQRKLNEFEILKSGLLQQLFI